MTLQEIKAAAKDKLCQGDVNIYALTGDPGLSGEKVADPVLVYGSGGNHHKLMGTNWKAIKTSSGAFVVEVTKTSQLSHEQHEQIKLAPGFFLIDRAREKGMFSDMINPVQD